MKMAAANRKVSDLSSEQWGFFTAAQASERGVSGVDLGRLVSVGAIERLAHGVYRDSGAPRGEYEELRVAWLSAEPAKPVVERLAERHLGVVVAGASSAWVHQIGDLAAFPHEFVTPIRRQTQRIDLRYRRRELQIQDVALAAGLPTMTRERTIADLIELRTDLSLVADVLRDAAYASVLDSDRLIQLLGPLASRNGFRKGDGAALFEYLIDLAGLDVETQAKQILGIPELREAISHELLKGFDFSENPDLAGFKRISSTISEAASERAHIAISPQLMSVGKGLKSEIWSQSIPRHRGNDDAS